MKGLIITILIVLAQSLQAQPSEWTVKTLKEYIDQQNKFVQERFDILDNAIIKQENAYNDRFDNTNEWRRSYEDLITKMQDLIRIMQNDFVPRTELVGINRQLTEQKERLDKYENMRAGGNVIIAYIVAGISFLVAIFALSRNFIASIYKYKQKSEL